MKVLKKGREQKGWSIQHLCTGAGNGGGGCKAELLVEIGDVFETEQNCLHETDYFTTFRCPQCGVLTDLESVPGHVRDAAVAQRHLWRDPTAGSFVGKGFEIGQRVTFMSTNGLQIYGSVVGHNDKHTEVIVQCDHGNFYVRDWGSGVTRI